MQSQLQQLQFVKEGKAIVNHDHSVVWPFETFTFLALPLSACNADGINRGRMTSLILCSMRLGMVNGYQNFKFKSSVRTARWCPDLNFHPYLKNCGVGNKSDNHEARIGSCHHPCNLTGTTPVENKTLAFCR